MSTGFIFKEPGRLFKYLNVDLNATKDEIYEKYTKASYSTENTWPDASPLAGYYDISNSDTKLILLNNQKLMSHLRGQIKPKKSARVQDEFYDWVEIEHQENLMRKKEFEANKNREKESINLRQPDPSRHFRHLGCTYKTGSEMPSRETSSKQHRRTKSAQAHLAIPQTDNNERQQLQQNDDLNKELLKYFHFISKREVGYQNCNRYKAPPQEFRESYNLNHPNLSKGQKLYLYEMCRSYSTTNLKDLKKHQYIELLEKRKSMDSKYRPQFKFNSKQNQNYHAYERYLFTARAQPILNTGFISSRRLKPHSKATIAQVRPETAIPGKRQVPEIRQIKVSDEEESLKSFSKQDNESSIDASSTSSATHTLSKFENESDYVVNEREHVESSSSAGSISRSYDSNRYDIKHHYSDVSSLDSFISSSTISIRKNTHESTTRTASTSEYSFEMNRLSSKLTSTSSESKRNGHVAPSSHEQRSQSKTGKTTKSTYDSIDARLKRIRRKLSDLSPDQSTSSISSYSNNDTQKKTPILLTPSVSLKDSPLKLNDINKMSKNSLKSDSSTSSV